MKNKTLTWTIFGIIAVMLVIAGVLFAIHPKQDINGNLLSQSGQSKEPIKIGIIGHFSGEYASYGIPMKNAVELAIDEANKAGGINGHQLVLVVEDDGTDPAKAASGMNKLIHVDDIDYIISAQGSAATSVITPIAEDNSRILMITLGSAPGLTDGKDHVFRSVPSDVNQASKMAEYINAKFNGDANTKRIAGLYRNDPYGIGIRDIIEKNVGAKVVASELYDPSSSDFRTQLTRIKEANPDMIVIAGQRDNYPIILKQIRESGISAVLFASETFYDEDMLRNSPKDGVEGVYTLFQKDPTDYVDFRQKYVGRFKEEPSSYSMYAYDGAMSIIKSLKDGDDVEAVRKNLLETSFDGASGSIGFDNEGDRMGIEYSVYQVRNGEFVQVG